MTLDRKLIRNGNSWAMCLNSTILKMLSVDPEVDMVRYTMVEDKLIITKGDKIATKKRSS